MVYALELLFSSGILKEEVLIVDSAGKIFGNKGEYCAALYVVGGVCRDKSELTEVSRDLTLVRVKLLGREENALTPSESLEKLAELFELTLLAVCRAASLVEPSFYTLEITFGSAAVIGDEVVVTVDDLGVELSEEFPPDMLPSDLEFWKFISSR